ncbi:hypothetical protein D3C71_1811400 [compost metagenome]
MGVPADEQRHVAGIFSQCAAHLRVQIAWRGVGRDGGDFRFAEMGDFFAEHQGQAGQAQQQQEQGADQAGPLVHEEPGFERRTLHGVLWRLLETMR